MCLFIRMLTYHLVERFINVINILHVIRIIYSRPYIFISRNISESLSIFICLISPPLGCQRPSLKPILPSKSNLVYVKKKVHRVHNDIETHIPFGWYLEKSNGYFQIDL